MVWGVGDLKGEGLFLVDLKRYDVGWVDEVLLKCLFVEVGDGELKVVVLKSFFGVGGGGVVYLNRGVGVDGVGVYVLKSVFLEGGGGGGVEVLLNSFFLDGDEFLNNLFVGCMVVLKRLFDIVLVWVLKLFFFELLY